MAGRVARLGGRTFASLRNHRNFRLYFVSHSVSFAGTWIVLWGSSALASMQLAAPDHLRGQAASLYFFAFQGGAPLGGLLAGWLTSRGGTALAFAVAGTAAVFISIAGTVTLIVLEPRTSRIEGDWNADHA